MLGKECSCFFFDPTGCGFFFLWLELELEGPLYTSFWIAEFPGEMLTVFLIIILTFSFLRGCKLRKENVFCSCDSAKLKENKPVVLTWLQT